ncbi:MAG: 4a-hydroxytetrahydrobiopterin dehydratase [Myxococcales bacterium]|nr:4a-hydroxytetrahydrobiopterin dehydratase [Myxococcales bacterium]USN51421.1 MAG: 4a-hydroxytetrahydrobiopterin dehydratase [Myxococcales bacterium]
MSLVEKKCQACEGGVPPVGPVEAARLLKEISGWSLDTESKSIQRFFSFKGFYSVMSFVNAVAYIAQKEGHHPDMRIGYNYVDIKFTTHAISGLSENDFICAAKVNTLL